MLQFAAMANLDAIVKELQRERDRIDAACNESLFSPPPKTFFLKLSSAWREEIVIGASVAIAHFDAKVGAATLSILKLKWLCRVKQKRALRGRNHAEG
jgi:hypothetical protein